MLPEELKEKAKALKEKTREIEKLLDLTAKQERLAELEKAAADPQLWGDQNRAKTLLQEKKVLEKEQRDCPPIFGAWGQASQPSSASFC